VYGALTVMMPKLKSIVSGTGDAGVTWNVTRSFDPGVRRSADAIGVRHARRAQANKMRFMTDLLLGMSTSGIRGARART